MEEKTFYGDQGVTGYVLDIPAEILAAACHNEWIAFFVKVFGHGVIVVNADAAPDVGVDRFQAAATHFVAVIGDKVGKQVGKQESGYKWNDVWVQTEHRRQI